MQPSPNVAVRRFRLVRYLSIVVKVAALAGILVFVVLVYSGGH